MNNESEILDKDFDLMMGRDDSNPSLVHRANGIKKELNGYLSKIRAAKWTILILAIFSAIGSLVSLRLNDQDFTGIPNSYILVEFIIVGSVYIGSFIFFNRKPLLCTSLVLGVYISLQFLTAFFDIGTLLSGLFIKIIILTFLIRGFFALRDQKECLQRFKAIGITESELACLASLSPLPMSNIIHTDIDEEE